MFKLEDIKYKDILAVESLEIPANKITCIVGPSGAGKSTLLRLLNNLISPKEGQILYQGVNIEQKDPVKLRQDVMMLGQKTVIFPGTIQNNLEEIFRLTERKPPEVEKLAEILKFVSLDKELTEEAEYLSGGEQQRLALARLLLLKPEVLLLDEPSSDLDDQTEFLIVNSLVKYVKATDKTMIMVTHSQEIAKEYGDQIITMAEGKVNYLAGSDK